MSRRTFYLKHGDYPRFLCRGPVYLVGATCKTTGAAAGVEMRDGFNAGAPIITELSCSVNSTNTAVYEKLLFQLGLFCTEDASMQFATITVEDVPVA